MGRLVSLLAALLAAVVLPAAPARAAVAEGTEQLVVTGSVGSPRASLDGYLFSGGRWHHVLTAPARVGRHGLTSRPCEGCGATPMGTFPLGSTMYGVSTSRPSSRYAYHHLVCGDWWDENPSSRTYNRFVHRTCGAPGPGGNSEALWRATVAYQHFAVIGFNMNPVVAGKGSGIFLHDQTSSPWTAGCVALAPSALDTVLRWLDPARHPTIRIATTPGPR